MSLYNMICGYNPACFWLMPMLGRRQDEWPRFRDCFVGDKGDTIVIYTRVGGGNRNAGYGEEELYQGPNFVKTWDDEYDSTYGYYEFRVPEKWKSDFDKIVSGQGRDISDDYKAVLHDFFPKLAPQILDPDVKTESET